MSSIPLGFIIEAGEDVHIYHSGDTTIFGDLTLIGDLYEPTVGLVSVGVPREHQRAAHGVSEYLTGEMDAREAALACEWLGLDYAIPCHYDDPELPEIVKLNELLTAARQSDAGAPEPVILSPGERFLLPKT